MTCQGGDLAPSLLETDGQLDPMSQDDPAPQLTSPSASQADLHNIDLQLALNVLEQIDLPPICVRWEIGYEFLLHHFQPSDLFCTRIPTFRYIPGDARPLFRQCYVGVLTLLDALPAFKPISDGMFSAQKGPRSYHCLACSTRPKFQRLVRMES